MYILLVGFPFIIAIAIYQNFDVRLAVAALASLCWPPCTWPMVSSSAAFAPTQ